MALDDKNKNNQEEDSDLLDKLIASVFLIIVAVGILYVVVKYIVFFFTTFKELYVVYCLAIVLAGIFLLIIRKEIPKYKAKEKEEKEKAKRQKEKDNIAEKKRQNDEYVKKHKLYDAPDTLTAKQKEKLKAFLLKFENYVQNNYAVKNFHYLPLYSYQKQLSDPQLYTLLFFHEDRVVVGVESYSGEKTTIILSADENGDPIILDEDSIASFKIGQCPDNERAYKKKHMRRSKRGPHADKPKEKGSVVKNGKKHQAPNYEFLAKEWVVNNMGYLNKKVADKIAAGEKDIVLIIPEEKLPEDRETWKHIGEKLKADNEIDQYVIVDDGLRIKI
jgi:hypothetical protein